ncbi:MAG: GNAT family N-acetyltransferase [Alphaproteobacteria bacterium]|nr:GNAT family N-acetyltransferase [Alphaproteobacteria bacterium]
MSVPAFEVVNNEAEGRFEVRLGGEVAYAEYRVLSNGILFPHTEVPPAFEGKGVGSALVTTALAWARARGAQVMPVCPFFAAYIKRHPEWHDIVHPHYKTALGIG